MTSLGRTTMAAFMAAGLTLGASGAVFAAGDGGTMTDSNSNTMALKCPKGQVFDPEAKGFFGVKGKCVSAEDLGKSGKTNSDKQSLIYDQGKALAKAERFEEAIAMLKLAPDQGDPRVLNYLGYSHRKLGRMDEALGYYHAAVGRNPDFSLVREYLGEAYIQLGLLEKAREQLSEIERICGSRSCSEYGELAELIVDSQITQ